MNLRLAVPTIASFLLLACSAPPPEAETTAVEPEGQAQSGSSDRPVNDRSLPEPYATPSARNSPDVVPRPEGAQLHVPDGFQVQEYAGRFEFNRPRFMLLGPGSEVLLADSADSGFVYVLQDTDQDGQADQRHVLIEGMYRPYGIAFWEDYVYVAGTLEVKRWKYDAASMRVSGEGEAVVSWPDFRSGHWTRSILFTPDGQKMLVSIGSGSNVDAGEDPRRAAVNRYNPDGSGHELFAEGLRNVTGMHYYPETDRIWAAVQERDALGDELVPDYFTQVEQGQFFGWPYAYIGPHEDPRRKDEQPELVARTRYPDVLLPAHCAVLDFEFYTGTQFPEQYRGGAFLAYHGSWNRAERIGYRVDFVPFSGGRPSAGPSEFLTGWMMDPKEKEVWGRPVGVVQLADGSLLVSDDGGRKIWRISYGN